LNVLKLHHVWQHVARQKRSRLGLDPCATHHVPNPGVSEIVLLVLVVEQVLRVKRRVRNEHERQTNCKQPQVHSVVQPREPQSAKKGHRPSQKNFEPACNNTITRARMCCCVMQLVESVQLLQVEKPVKPVKARVQDKTKQEHLLELGAC